jgi:predicted enzyme related to lactoylglutathione lyase
MSERESYNPGEFCWVDLAVPDPQAAAPYYKDLVGWDWEQGDPQFGGYGMFTLGDSNVAGMGPTMSDEQPPAWSSYVSVEDADATAARIGEAGGSVLMDPMDIADAGRMAVCQDPQGAFFGLWQPGLTHGAQRVNEVGNWTWNQLATTDLEDAERFYSAVFGWKLAGPPPEGQPEDGDYFMWHVADQRWEEGIAGGMRMESGRFPPGVPPHWMVYLAVEDADAAVATTREAGGQVMVEPTEIPVGRLAVMTDPQGAALGVIEPDYPDPR